MNRRFRQHGVALLTAVLLVALGTIVATAIAFQSAMSARRGSATFAFDQSLAFAQAAEALAAYALREDRKDGSSNQVDHPGENWAKPFGPVEVVPGVALEAQLQDLQGRFNLNNLVDDDGDIDENALAQFRRLLQLLELEEKWASLIADWIDKDPQPYKFEGGEDPLYLAQVPAYRPLNRLITSTTELLALPEFGRDRYLKLAPYVSALPHGTPINLCTAPGYVVDAMKATESDPDGGGGQDFSSDPDSLLKGREQGCFPTRDDFKQAVPQGTWQVVDKELAEKSDYFRLTSIVTVGDTQFALYSVMFRDNNGARPILRTFTPD